jgi:predicted RNA-binding protein with PUA domain
MERVMIAIRDAICKQMGATLDRLLATPPGAPRLSIQAEIRMMEKLLKKADRLMAR